MSEEKQEYLDLDLLSRRGNDDKTYGTTSYIKVNGMNVRSLNSYVPNATGHGIAVFNQLNGELESTVTFETANNNFDDKIATFLSRLDKNKIVVIVVHHCGEYSAATTKILANWGCTVDKPQHRESFIFIGSTNGPTAWTLSEKREPSKGPILRNISIPLGQVMFVYIMLSHPCCLCECAFCLPYTYIYSI